MNLSSSAFLFSPVDPFALSLVNLIRDQPCSASRDNRYLQCLNNTCQCPWQTYFDGSICHSEKLLDDDRLNTTECRSDLNYVCLSHLQYGLQS